MTKIANIFISALRKKNIHFFVIVASFIMQMFNFGSAYRFFAYSNLLAVLITLFYKYKISGSFKDCNWLKYLILFPLFFFIIHFVAVDGLVMIKEMRHILLSLFLAAGVAMLVRENDDYIKENIFWLVALIIFTYIAVQAACIWIFNKPYGTTKNPHYLALYSSICMITAIYCFLNASVKLKWMLGVSIMVLGMFLILSSSRPAWLSLIFTGVITTCFLQRRPRFYALFAMATILIVLTLTNIGNFSERAHDLIDNVSTEERVAIWQETWTMQTDSSLSEWIVGHGLDSFEENFKPYSSYHLKGVDFNSPHNYFLEILYLSGLAGILISFTMFWLIYKELFFHILFSEEYKYIYMLLMAVLTSNIIFASITLPFFTSYNMNVIALVVGTIIYMRQRNLKLGYE